MDFDAAERVTCDQQEKPETIDWSLNTSALYLTHISIENIHNILLFHAMYFSASINTCTCFARA